MNGDGYSRHGSSRDHHYSRSGRDDHRDRDRDRDRDRERGGRRRSRSPSHRSSRREYEVDSYSSSRDHREREREDRYRDRRDDREWDRDRGGRREPRRDQHERPPRRERDLMDDRGPRRGDREVQGPPPTSGRERKRSATPPPKKKEPTPDLTDVVPVLERRRRLNQWDIKPQGYENVTAEQAKLSGMFPLPGAPRQQPMDPSRLQAFMNQPAGSANNAALKPSNARQSKRLFVYNIPDSTDNDAMGEFFNLQLNGLNAISALDPCTLAQISNDRSYALLEFKTPEDATVALTFDGISMYGEDTANGDASGAQDGLKIQRPKDYITPSAPDTSEEQMGVVSPVVLDSPNKISITNIPTYLNDEQITELLTSFGELKSFVLVKDSGTEQSKGVAFCEYSDPETTDVAVEGLNGMELGEQSLKVQRAAVGSTQAAGLEMSVAAMSMLAGTSSTDIDQGRVIQLLNMVTPEELMDNDEYEEIQEDIKEECEKYGKIEEMKIPRPAGGSRVSPGVGKIFIKYDTAQSAQKAIGALAGRKFQDRTVVVTFFGEEYFDLNAW